MNTNILKTSKNIYKQAGKFDYRQQFKDILEADMVSTLEVFTNDSPISPMTSTPVKKPRDQKSLCLFTNISYVKKNCYPLSWTAESKRKSNNMVIHHYY